MIIYPSRFYKILTIKKHKNDLQKISMEINLIINTLCNFQNNLPYIWHINEKIETCVNEKKQWYVKLFK